MAWCEKCKGEYIEGITTCPKCGIALTEEPQIKKDEPKKKSKKSVSTNIKQTFLVNTSSMVELAYVTSLLDEMQIKYRVLEKDVGQYLSIRHGRSYIGKSVYVEEDRNEEAREVIDSYKAEILIEDELKSPIEVSSERIKTINKCLLVFVMFSLITVGGAG